ncbi:MAG: hypothetical protein P4M01_08580 [Acidobacteriota bacterium]|nr:hypothetical protein [Acidobacteriota bacterium]
MKHLTDEQIADWLAGESTAETRQHLTGCSECAAETAALSGGVRRYALAVRQDAQRSAARSLSGFSVHRELKWLRLRWAAAATLGLFLAGTTVYVVLPHEASIATRHVIPAPLPQPAPKLQPPPEVQIQTAAQPRPSKPAMSDDELLEAVNNDLSRDVPRALAPVSHITAERNQIAAASSAAGSGKKARQE